MARRRIGKLAAKIVHIYVHNVCGLCRLRVPHCFEKLHARNAVAAIEQQMFKQREFLVGDAQSSSATAHRMIETAQFEVAGTQHELTFFLPSQKRTTTRTQFEQAEWFGHQVVGAVVEAAYPRVHFVPAGEHKDRQFGVNLAHLPQCNLAVLDGHIQIKNRQVGHFAAECLDGLSSVVDGVHSMSVRLQSSPEEDAQSFIVFSDQQPHLCFSLPVSQLRFGPRDACKLA